MACGLCHAVMTDRLVQVQSACGIGRPFFFEFKTRRTQRKLRTYDEGTFATVQADHEVQVPRIRPCRVSLTQLFFNSRTPLRFAHACCRHRHGICVSYTCGDINMIKATVFDQSPCVGQGSRPRDVFPTHEEPVCHIQAAHAKPLLFGAIRWAREASGGAARTAPKHQIDGIRVDMDPGHSFGAWWQDCECMSLDLYSYCSQT
ncbi:hypothetical protein BCR44DRAFT_207372 [Catenaria anguillulae PL171]|uniref:Uncharacterized protein n=1 Tax=Catenaria anguillulae PL171 TaxID=765915 RepID=A0A1Y2HG25_9FUNG|nr:hypothetical protein BCR44DRAFT_207372 [Catenaria anguillulae PL171]